MKIGIITIHNSPSYGACLQSYALYKYLSLQSKIDCEIIDLHRPYQNDYVPSKSYKVFRERNCLCRRILRKLMHSLSSPKKTLYYSSSSVLKFENFNRKIKTSRPYLGIDDLYANPPKYDIYVTGSDQVWNPWQPYCVEPYFLTFVSNGGKKISYAASIGLSTLPEDIKRMYRKWLSYYDAISVRESQAKNMLSSFIDKPIVQVADPTFLLDVEYWKSISIAPQYDQSYILLFALDQNSSLFDYAKKLSQETGMPLLNLSQIQTGTEDDSYVAISDAGPLEFLGYIECAELVLTDSFHGTVFSMIMGSKNFYTYISMNNKRGSRITDLLAVHGLSSHLLDVRLNQSYASLAANKLNREKLLKSMEEERIFSRKFLLNQISD